MSRAIAAALVLAATALLAPASAIGQAAPNPDPLWSEFPLTPLVVTVPTSSTPAPALEQPVREDPTVRRGDSDRTAGFLILVGAAAGCRCGLRGTSASREAPGLGRCDPAGTGARGSTHLRTSHSGRLRRRARTVGRGCEQTPAARRRRATLVETLSPQARLADRLEEGETGAELRDAPDVRDRVLARATSRGSSTSSRSRRTTRRSFHRTSARPARERRSRPTSRCEAHAALVEALVAAGWEPEGYGEEWFSERFQRRRASA